VIVTDIARNCYMQGKKASRLDWVAQSTSCSSWLFSRTPLANLCSFTASRTPQSRQRRIRCRWLRLVHSNWQKIRSIWWLTFWKNVRWPLKHDQWRSPKVLAPSEWSIGKLANMARGFPKIFRESTVKKNLVISWARKSGFKQMVENIRGAST